jgi:uncharacterized delta-60 repeat protein
MAFKPLIRVFLVLCTGFVLLVGPSADAARPGALDSTFGRGGRVITDFGQVDGVRDIAVQPNGKIVAVGDSYELGSSADRFVLARYTKRGALDRTFGRGGEVSTYFGRDTNGAYAVAIQSDGRIVAAGVASGGAAATGIAVARYNANGSLDPTFGDGGRVVTDFDGSLALASAILVQPDGKIVVAGQRTPMNSFADFLLVRYTTSGALDQSFGNGGSVSTDFQPGWADLAFGVALAPGGKIVAAGWGLPQGAGSPGVIDLARYNPDGSLDTSFGQDGTVVSRPAEDNGAFSVVVQPDGKMVVAGFVGLSGLTLLRYSANGTLDLVMTTGPTGYANDVVRQPDGKLVAVGTTGLSGTDSSFAIARFTRAGRPDKSFHGGEVRTDMGGWDIAEAVALQPDGRIVVGGSTEQLQSGNTKAGNFALARYLGVASCRVPNVIGKTLRAAKATIARASCRLGRVRHRASTRAARGHITAQRPAAGRTLPSRGRVDVVVSRGAR